MRTFRGLTAIRTGTTLAALAAVILAGTITVFRAEATGGPPETWTAPAALNTNAATDTGSDGFIFGSPQVTTDGAGNWVAVWHSAENVGGTIGTDFDILVARSTDNGATWSAPAALNTNATTDTGSDSVPQVTTDGAGNWVAPWHSVENLGGVIGTDLDILVARSTDNGATWTAPAALNTNAATDTSSDHFPQVTTTNTNQTCRGHRTPRHLPIPPRRHQPPDAPAAAPPGRDLRISRPTPTSRQPSQRCRHERDRR